MLLCRWKFSKHVVHDIKLELEIWFMFPGVVVSLCFVQLNYCDTLFILYTILENGHDAVMHLLRWNLYLHVTHGEMQ